MYKKPIFFTAFDRDGKNFIKSYHFNYYKFGATSGIQLGSFMLRRRLCFLKWRLETIVNIPTFLLASLKYWLYCLKMSKLLVFYANNNFLLCIYRVQIGIWEFWFGIYYVNAYLNKIPELFCLKNRWNISREITYLCIIKIKKDM